MPPPALLLRLEGAVLFVAAVLTYWRLGGDWLPFVLLILAPDLAALGYLAGLRVGAATYNAAHTSALPLALAAASWLAEATWLVPFAAIWLAHIGVDRAIGYGLKYPTAFKDTHLSRL